MSRGVLVLVVINSSNCFVVALLAESILVVVMIPIKMCMCIETTSEIIINDTKCRGLTTTTSSGVIIHSKQIADVKTNFF